MRTACTVIVASLALAGCDRDRGAPPPPPRTEPDQQVKRLRDDTEIELQDLRGRWLATEAMLTRERDELKKMKLQVASDTKRIEDRLTFAEVEIGWRDGRMRELEVKAAAEAPPPSVEDRLARSYEELYCLRKQGAEEGVAEVYRRWGFESPEQWADAWQRAARSNAFERDVRARVDRLCP